MRTRGRAPGAHAGVGTRLLEVDRGLAALLMLFAVLRHPVFVGAPAQLGRLEAFGDEAVDRPGVPEDVERLRVLGALGVTLGNMDALDAELLHQLGPAFAIVGGRLFELHAGFIGEIDERLLDEPRDHARVCAAGRHGGGATGVLVLLGAQGFAQRIVGALRVLHVLVEVEAEPGLNDGVDVENVELAAELHQIDRAGVDRQVDEKALARAFGQERLQELLVVVLGDMGLDMLDAVLGQKLGLVVAGIDDHHPALVELEVTFDQGQCSTADRAEADHDDRAGDLAIYRIGFLGHFLLLAMRGRPADTGGSRS